MEQLTEVTPMSMLDKLLVLFRFLFVVSLAGWLLYVGINDIKAPCDEDIDLWLLVAGGTTLLISFLHICLLLVIYIITPKDNTVPEISHTEEDGGGMKPAIKLVVILTILICLIALFSLVWFIIGNVWIFGTSQCSVDDTVKCCEKSLYNTAFLYIMLCYGLLLLQCSCNGINRCIKKSEENDDSNENKDTLAKV